MDEKVARLSGRVAHRELAAGSREDRAGITDLAPRLAVERGLVDDDRDRVARFGRLDLFATLEDGQDDALGAFGLVAEEFGRANLVAQREPLGASRRLARADPALARFLALALHRRVEPGGGDLAAAAAQHVLGEIERKTVCVVEPECHLPRDILAAFD